MGLSTQRPYDRPAARRAVFRGSPPSRLATAAATALPPASPDPRAYREASPDDAGNALTANDQGFFKALQSAFGADDKSWLVAHMTFPFHAALNGRQTVSAQEFLAHYQDIVTVDVKDEIREQKPEGLFKRFDGLCAGTGCVLWFGYAVSPNGRYRYTITTINTPGPPPPPANGCNLQRVDWKNLSYPSGSFDSLPIKAFHLHNGSAVERFDSDHHIDVDLAGVSYGDIEGKAGQQAFVRMKVFGIGETLGGFIGPAVYVFEGDDHCAPRPVGSLFFTGDPVERPGRIVNGAYVDHDGARWTLVDHKLRPTPAR